MPSDREQAIYRATIQKCDDGWRWRVEIDIRNGRAWNGVAKSASEALRAAAERLNQALPAQPTDDRPDERRFECAHGHRFSVDSSVMECRVLDGYDRAGISGVVRRLQCPGCGTITLKEIPPAQPTDDRVREAAQAVLEAIDADRLSSRKILALRAALITPTPDEEGR